MTHVERLYKITARMTKNTNGRAARHMSAVNYPQGSEGGFISIFKGWLQFADDQKAQYDNPIGNDYYAGDIWARIGLELRQLLSCDIGSRLDCGTLDGIILDVLEAEGFDENEERA